MKCKVSVAVKDLGDGSQSVCIFNTREEGLEYLNRTEEELEEGNSYDDGILVDTEMEFELIDGNLLLKTPFKMYTD